MRPRDGPPPLRPELRLLHPLHLAHTAVPRRDGAPRAAGAHFGPGDWSELSCQGGSSEAHASVQREEAGHEEVQRAARPCGLLHLPQEQEGVVLHHRHGARIPEGYQLKWPPQQRHHLLRAARPREQGPALRHGRQQRDPADKQRGGGRAAPAPLLALREPGLPGAGVATPQRGQEHDEAPAAADALVRAHSHHPHGHGADQLRHLLRVAFPQKV
mmetsp:Transcript_84589/g.252064  ORF Transcript_84589/g.252064 Transcript_84589/m.252064 type:complete len:215 (+) Transcript_84589:1667-2311(+)